jgi:hypothetical protein
MDSFILQIKDFFETTLEIKDCKIIHIGNDEIGLSLLLSDYFTNSKTNEFYYKVTLEYVLDDTSSSFRTITDFNYKTDNKEFYIFLLTLLYNFYKKIYKQKKSSTNIILLREFIKKLIIPTTTTDKQLEKEFCYKYAICSQCIKCGFVCQTAGLCVLCRTLF